MSAEDIQWLLTWLHDIDRAKGRGTRTFRLVAVEPVSEMGEPYAAHVTVEHVPSMMKITLASRNDTDVISHILSRGDPDARSSQEAQP